MVWGFVVTLSQILDLKESLLELHNKMTETNCCENSEQISRLLETFLILVKHGSGSKITRPADVCRVSLVCLGVC